MLDDIVHDGFMGLLTSVVAPLFVLATLRSVPWQRVPAPPTVVLPMFVVMHAVITIATAELRPGLLADAALHLALFAGAVVFWLPVLVPGRRMRPAGRSVYLFLAAPSLDLAAIYLIIGGNSAGGLAMIVGMLPIGLAAVGVTWRWITTEERLVAASVPAGQTHHGSSAW